MELSEVIRKRRSVRTFDGTQDVSDEDIQTILEAGIQAPSSGNTQCWHFVVVKDPDLKTKLSTDAGHQSFIREVPVVIVVCIDLEVSANYGERGINTYSLQDTAAAIQNMLLTITDLGLATCWVGAFNEEPAAEILSLREGLRPIAMLPIGYPIKSPNMPKRKSIDEVTEWR